MAQWVRFFRVLLLIFIPSLTFFATVEYVGFRAGETLPISNSAQRQHDADSMLWLTRFSGIQYIQFKLARLALDRPDVVVMGSSRATQVRSGIFKPYSFYNLSLTSWTFSAYIDIIKNFPEGYAPKVIVFNLDFFMFNPVWHKKNLGSHPVFTRDSSWAAHIQRLRQVVKAVWETPSLLTSIWQMRELRYGADALGITALTRSAGFRKDGSLQYDETILSGAGKKPNMMTDVTLGMMPLFFGSEMANAEVTQFEEFVALAKSKGIALVGIQTPMFDPLNHAVERNEGYGILRSFEMRIRSGWLKRLGVQFFDFRKFRPYSADYRYFIDVIHSSEAVYIAMVEQMMADPDFSKLLPAISTARLRKLLKKDRMASQHINFFYNTE